MSSVINRLSEYVANQIAAGEVVVGPYSVVKELMENAIDASAELVIVSIKGAGSGCIQVVDDGKGMSPEDAVKCFERHATSKISDINDIYSLASFGFRGEALASIAAVAEVELKTRQEDSEIGTKVVINGGKLIGQQAEATAKGTQFIVKNLFYNIPARRNFLKSPRTELRNIVQEFERVALCYPRVSFFLYSEEECLFNLPAASLRHRVLGIVGKTVNNSLLELYIESPLVEIRGYIGKPETAKKNAPRFMFVNGRYFQEPYLNKAIQQAYDKLLPAGSQLPPFFLYFTVDPASVDVNISPSKTQVKFDNIQAIFQILMCAAKESLAKNGIVPMIDFEAGDGFDVPLLKEGETVSRPDITLSSGGFFNPFDEEFSFSKAVEGFDNSFRTNIIDGSPLDIPDAGGQTMPVSEESFIEFDSETPATESVSSAANSDSNVRTGYAEESFSTPADMFNAASERRAYSATPAARSFTTDEAVREETTPTEQYIEIDEPELKASGCFPLPGGYVAAAVSGRLLMVNVRRARQRLFFDRMWTICSSEHAMPRQKLMFESVTELTPADMRLARECEADLRELGFDFEFSDENNVTITAVPADDTSSDAGALFEEVLQGVKTAEEGVYVSDKKERFIASLARAAARSGSSTVNGKEAEALIDELLKCKNFTYTPDGTRIYVAMSRTDIDNLF